jgi:hypothetical protein
MGRSMPRIARRVNPGYLVVVISFLVNKYGSVFRFWSTFLKKLAIPMIFNNLPKQKYKKASNTNNLAKPCHYKPPPLAVLLVNNTNAFRSILVPCQACQRFFFTL